jgi:hypothetical protein
MHVDLVLAARVEELRQTASKAVILEAIQGILFRSLKDLVHAIELLTRPAGKEVKRRV